MTEEKTNPYFKSCKVCKEGVAIRAKTCPHCGAKDPTITIKDQMVAITFLLLIVLLVSYCALGNEGNESITSIEVNTEQQTKAPKQKLFGDKIGATTFCQMHVKNALKSPGSAKFSWKIEIDTFPTENFTKYHILSYVDSQNSFGGLLRTYYKCKLNSTGSDFSNWELLDLKLEQKQ